ncbi:L,D-transpeptidase [Bauldia litoralis]|uniref:L,D-transpeptidase n=1 Tax=Bauldia litoralis TaxID=665467 RepID=UPI0032673F13
MFSRLFSLTGMPMTFEPLFPTRRAALAGLAGLAGTALLARPGLATAAERALKPGQFIWQPELQKRGATSIIVSIGAQMMHVHRRGVRIGVSTVSTGKTGHDTPTGVFTILQKNKDHVSNIYEGAEMPFMQRLTWTGIALHAGNLPGYPASHGCVRMPLDFAELLFGATRLGTPVVVASAFSEPEPVSSPNFVGEFYSAKALAGLRRAERSYLSDDPEDRPVTSVLVSRQDSRAIVLQNGDIVAEGPVEIAEPDRPFPSNVFVLSGAGSDEEGLRWEAIGYSEGSDAQVSVPDSLTLDRIKAPADLAAAIAKRVAPGMLFVVTDDPLATDTRSASDFVVMTAEGEEE